MLLWLLGSGWLLADELSAQLPPLEPFFVEPGRFHECLSPSGRWISFLGPNSGGVNQLWMVSTENPGKPVCISDPVTGAVTTCFWVRGERLVWQVRGAKGNPRFFVGIPGQGSVEEIPLPDGSVVSLAGVSAGDAEPCLILGIAANPTATPNLYRLTLDEGAAPVRIFTNHQRVCSWGLDIRGVPVAGVRWIDGGAKELVDLRDGGDRVLLRVPGGDDLRLLAASDEGRQAWIITNQGSELTQLKRIDLVTGAIQAVAADPLGRVDVENVIFDPQSNRPVAVSYFDEVVRWQPLEREFDNVLQRTMKTPDDGELVVAGFSADRSRWLLGRQRGGQPASVWLYNSASRRLGHLWNERPGIDPAWLCQTKPISITVRDGTRIPAFLTTPRTGKEPWPMVVFPHGGPHMRTVTGFDGRVQFLASRGYAVLQPNFRGSRGYGKSFMNASDRQWGTGIMQNDLTDSVKAMVQRGIAAKHRVAIFGGSYGGYAAMAGLAFTPDVYAAGISLFGISDLNDYLSHLPPDCEPFVGDLVRQLGDPSTPDGHADLESRSPLHHVAAVSSPLLIYHGLMDPLIAPDHGRKMAAALQSTRKSFSYLVAPDEPHGFTRAESEMAVYRAVEQFLHEHLGGELGAEPTTEVRARLEEFSAAGGADLQQYQKATR
ncbi:alpha/beta hydrolase family protein [Luteolibacter soli]|uniref:Prolyl oligopeptidase family serine peptidase n=1 Tax=Luteolibacter soli TaxID=3135280 RepID=A0ABU9B355_9BACT